MLSKIRGVKVFLSIILVKIYIYKYIQEKTEGKYSVMLTEFSSSGIMGYFISVFFLFSHFFYSEYLTLIIRRNTYILGND